MNIISIPPLTLFSVLLLGGPFSTTAPAQQVEAPPQKAPCIHASTITRDNAGANTDKGAWTTASATSNGLLSLTYCGVFKSGATTVSRLSIAQLSDLPTGFESYRKYAEMVREKIEVKSLPAGFTVYKDMAFEIRTEAIPNMKYLTFRVPSIQSEEEFKKLAILYLDETELLPGALDWKTSYLELDIPKADFKTRTLSAVFDFASVFHHATYTGRVIVASFDEKEFQKSSVDLYINSVVGPPYVKVGETFTYSVTVANAGRRRLQPRRWFSTAI